MLFESLEQLRLFKLMFVTDNVTSVIFSGFFRKFVSVTFTLGGSKIDIVYPPPDVGLYTFSYFFESLIDFQSFLGV